MINLRKKMKIEGDWQCYSALQGVSSLRGEDIIKILLPFWKFSDLKRCFTDTFRHD